MTHLIIFQVCDRVLGLRTENVIEIVRSVEITRLLDTRPPFLGIINYRGQIVPVAQVSGWLGLPGVSADEAAHMILVGEQGQAKICLLVNQVVAFCEASELQPTRESRYTPELARLADQIVPVLALNELLKPTTSTSFNEN